jgi:sulfur-carrier protein
VIVILVPGVLRGDVDGAARLSIDLDGSAVLREKATLGAVLDQVAERWPRFERRVRDERGELRRYVNVYVDGDDCRHLAGLATPIGDRTEIQVLPSVAGG